MSSFVFTYSALRSLEQDKDMLERDRTRRQIALHRQSSYILQRDRVRLRSGPVPPSICQDVLVHNALYTGDLEALQRLFPLGVSANLVLEPQGGDMRWVAEGDEVNLVESRSPTSSSRLTYIPHHGFQEERLIPRCFPDFYHGGVRYNGQIQW